MTAERTDSVYLDSYVATRDRIAGLMVEYEGGVPVPTCPGWRILDVLAHLAGLCEDWVNHQLDGYASESWTAAQVARFAQHSCPEILDRWADTMGAFAALGDDLVTPMGDDPVTARPPARWALGDAVIHEADIRGALAVDRVPNEPVLLGLDSMLERWQTVLSGGGAPTLHFRPPDGPDRWIGAAHSPGAVTCEAQSYEVWRALAGRRSADQVRSWGWSADPDPFLRAGLPAPFRWADHPIAD